MPFSGSLIGNIVLTVQICTAYPRPPVTELDFAIGAGAYSRFPESARHGAIDNVLVARLPRSDHAQGAER